MRIADAYNSFAQATDPVVMHRRFSSRLAEFAPEASKLISCDIPRAFLKKEAGFVIQYELMVAGSGDRGDRRIILGGLLSHPEAGGEKIDSGQANQTLRFDDLSLTVPIFPNDRKLKDLQILFSDEILSLLEQSGSERLQRILPTKPELLRSELLAYRPERRCVVRLDFGSVDLGGDQAGEFSLIGKMMLPRVIDRQTRCGRLLEESGFRVADLAVPEIFHVDRDRGLVLMSHISGSTVYELLASNELAAACRQSAGVLERLHLIKSSSLPVHSWEDELSSLGRFTARISQIFPDMKASYEEAMEQLMAASGMALSEAQRVSVHGDFYGKQLIFDKGVITLVDFDGLSQGDPAQDYGNFLAHLTLRRLQKPDLNDNIMKGEDAFKAGQLTSDTPLIYRTRFWQEATLIRLSGLYLLRPRWRHLGRRLIDGIIEPSGNETKAKETR